jgi:hypothetical protein
MPSRDSRSSIDEPPSSAAEFGDINYRFPDIRSGCLGSVKKAGLTSEYGRESQGIPHFAGMKDDR